MLTRLRLLTGGESHGPRLTGILEGLPAGLPLEPEAIDAELARRQRGFGAGGRMKVERDRVLLTGGVMAGRTTGAPLAFTIENRDWANWAERDVAPMTRPRPGHVDLVAAIKYGHGDLRLGLERASARETAARVAAGAACKRLLAALGVEVGGYALRIGEEAVEAAPSADPDIYRARFRVALENDLACPDAAGAERMRALVARWRKERDTVGGVLEVFALGLPPGLGSYVHFDRRLDGRLAMALLSVPGLKGVEVGAAFEDAARRGTAVQDPILRDDDGALLRATNRAGGLEGGVTTGQPLVLRAAMKPLSTTLTPLPTVDLATGAPADAPYERSDVCALPRAVPIAEAMLALVLADALLEKLGGDSLDELRGRLERLRRAHLDDLPLDDRPWRFGYKG